MDQRFRLDGKVALITGASRGIGAGIADALHEAGATVVGTSRNRQDGFTERWGTPPVIMDVTDVSSVRTGVDRVASEFGPGRTGEQRRRQRSSRGFRGG
jgi:NAD(P)-dependent dehydrogenase (short-subunit alcohol dehydrogenase family)